MEQKRLFLVDVDELLEAWSANSSTTFDHFKSLWQERNFSLIHEGRPKDLDRRTSLQTLYTAGLQVLGRPDNSLHLKAGALYMIYALFETQPGSYKQRVRVYMSPEDLDVFRAFVTEACGHGLADAAMVARRMIQSGAFLFGAVHNRLSAEALRGPAAIIQKYRDKLLPAEMLEEHFEKPVGDSLPLYQVDQDARDYNEARKRLVAAKRGPLAETDDPPYISLAEDLLRASATLDREVRSTLRDPPRPTPPARRSATPAADVSAMAGGSGHGEAPPADVSGAARGSGLGSAGRADVSAGGAALGIGAAAHADVSDRAGGEEAAPTDLPQFTSDLSLPVHRMPSIPGLASAPADLMDVDRPESPSKEDAFELDDEDFERAFEAVDEEEQPDPTASDAPDTAEGSPEQHSVELLTREEPGGSVRAAELSLRETDGQGETGTPAENGNIDENNAHDGEGMEVDYGNGVLDRRRNGLAATGGLESSDSDEDVDIRRPLPRAHSPLRI